MLHCNPPELYSRLIVQPTISKKIIIWLVSMLVDLWVMQYIMIYDVVQVKLKMEYLNAVQSLSKVCCALFSKKPWQLFQAFT